MSLFDCENMLSGGAGLCPSAAHERSAIAMCEVGGLRGNHGFTLANVRRLEKIEEMEKAHG
jgi:hypothetical protein